MGSGASVQSSPRHEIFDVDETMYSCSPLLGLKIKYWPEFIAAFGGEDALADFTTYDVCENFIKPATKESCSSFCEYLQRAKKHQAVSPASIRVIYAWKMKFLDVINALAEHFREDEEQVIWLDVFSINQHMITEKTPEWWNTSFQTTFQSIKRVVTVLNPWDESSSSPSSSSLPIVFRRTWCLYEIYNSIQSNCAMEILFAPRHREEVLSHLQTNSIAMIRRLISINCATSESSITQEKQDILSIIQREIGFSRLNNVIYETMKNLLIEFLYQAIEKEPVENRLTRSNLQYALGNVLLIDNEDNSSFVEKGLIQSKIAYEIRLEVLGIKDPQTWKAKQRVGYCQFLQQSAYDAEEMIEDCYERQRAKLGEDHLDTIDSAYSLAKVYQSLQYDADAEPLYKDCLERYTRLLGAEHFETQKVKIDIALFHVLYNRFEEAVVLAEEVYEQRLHHLGEEHRDTVAAMVGLATIYNKMKHSKTEEFIIKCYELKKTIYGEDHMSTISAMINVGMYFKSSQSYDKAEDWYRRCITISQHILGPTHPTSVGVKINLAVLLAHVGRVQEAIDSFLENYRCVVEKNGMTNNVQAQKIIKNLQLLLQKEGRVDEIDDLLNSALNTQNQVETRDFIIDDTAQGSSSKIEKKRSVSWSSSY